VGSGFESRGVYKLPCYCVPMVEQQKYSRVVELPGGIEIRDYPEHHRVSVDVAAGLSDAGSLGFRPLVSYISGNNSSAQSIAMTAPVLQTPQDSSHQVVSFVLPSAEADRSWPQPSDPRVQIERRPSCLVAALRFRGYWRVEEVKKRARELLSALESSEFRPVGEPFFARYNPPTTPGFLRRNEVLVEVERV
jgi:hypothetical protein